MRRFQKKDTFFSVIETDGLFIIFKRRTPFRRVSNFAGVLAHVVEFHLKKIQKKNTV